MNELDLSVVIPVFNNTATLPDLLARLLAVLEKIPGSFEILFVDDGSVDGSREWLQERSTADPRVRLLRLAGNFGGQAALCAGFERVRGRRTICMDADLENYPEDIPAFLAALDRGYELACGVRERRRGAGVSRRLPSALLNAYARRRLRTHVRDLWCGMRAMDSRVIENLAAEGERRRLLTALFIERARSVVEVPIRHDPAKDGSGYSVFRLAAIAADFCMGTARRPFVALAVWSVAVALAASVMLALAVASDSTPGALAALVVVVGSTLGLLVAWVGDYVQRLFHLQQGRPFFRVSEEDARARRSDDDNS